MKQRPERQEKISMKLKGGFLIKNKIEKTLARLRKKRKKTQVNKIRNERGHIYN